LSRIARETGGSVRSSLDGLFRERLKQRFGYQDISAALLWFGATLLILSVVARRYKPPAVVRSYLLAIRQALQPKTGSLVAEASTVAPRPIVEHTPTNGDAAAHSARLTRESAPVSEDLGLTPRFSARARAPQDRPPTAAQVLLERRRKRGQKT